MTPQQVRVAFKALHPDQQAKLLPQLQAEHEYARAVQAQQQAPTPITPVPGGGVQAYADNVSVVFPPERPASILDVVVPFVQMLCGPVLDIGPMCDAQRDAQKRADTQRVADQTSAGGASGDASGK